MTLFDELRSVVSALDGAGVDYALVGGLAVAVWGAPRATKDIDLLVPEHEIARVTDILKREGYFASAAPWPSRGACAKMCCSIPSGEASTRRNSSCVTPPSAAKTSTVRMLPPGRN